MDHKGQDLIQAALDYATRRGFAVFPCRSRAKVPATDHGFYDAVKDRGKVTALWSGRIDSNVAIRTGKESGIIVLDKDPRNGGNDSLSELERTHGKLPETPTAQSGRGDGGEHYYFKYPDDGLPVPKQTLAPGIDILSDGGYVMAPPSIHPDSGLPYHWKPGSGLDETPVAEIPGWLLALIRAEQHTNGKGFTPPPVFEGGERNNYLYKTGRKLHASLGSSEAEILASLLAINQERCKEPLTKEEVEEIAHNCATQKDRADFKAQKSARPEIVLWPSNLPWSIDQAERILIKNAERLKLFQRSDGIVQIIRLNTNDPKQLDKHGLRRQPGTIQLNPVSVAALQEILDREICFTRPAKKGNVPTDCPPAVATRYLHGRKGQWQLPTLTGIIEAPILRPDGTCFSKTGTYDPATGLYLQSEVDWGDVPDEPTKAEAEAAMSTLLEPFSEFPFVTPADKSVLVSGILTALQRRLLDSAPLHGFSAPSQRHGKSMLAEAICILATGRKPPCVGVPVKPEEFDKTLIAILREGHLITLFDNVVYPLRSDKLAIAITQSLYSGRVLGFSEMLKLPTNMMWMASGNNLEFEGDITSRALLGTIDSGCERPEERVFTIADLPAHLLEHRRELVIAALTVLRGYIVAGSPRHNLKPWGGFDQWSAEIRGALLWLGLADPVTTRELILASDPERERIGEIFEQWNKAYDQQEVTTSELIASLGRGEHPELLAALLLVAADKNDRAQLDPRRLGQWCRSHKGRIVNGLRLHPFSEPGRKGRWAVFSSTNEEEVPF